MSYIITIITFSQFDHIIPECLTYLADEPEVGDTHGTGSEQNLQVLRKLCSPSVARVHGDEVADGRDQGDHGIHEVKCFPLVSDGVLDSLHLDCDDREDLHRDPVELIKAAPGSGLSQTLKI